MKNNPCTVYVEWKVSWREKTRGVPDTNKRIANSHQNGIIEVDKTKDKGVGILIDKYTPCLVDRQTGEIYETELEKLSPNGSFVVPNSRDKRSLFLTLTMN